jgi:hypothetical protein
MQDNLAQTLKEVHKALEMAKGCNMQTEVVAFAMTYLKENDTLSIGEALQLALTEWDIK